MSIEIDVLNGDASWPIAKPVFDAVWPPEVVAKLPWAGIVFANAELRVLVQDELQGVVCHVGVYRREVTWNGQKMRAGGIGGVAPLPGSQRRGYASIALNAAIQTMRDHEAVRFALLFCEPHNRAFYQSRGWHPFTGEIYAEQAGGKIRFEALAPLVFDLGRAPREGVIDLCGLPW